MHVDVEEVENVQYQLDRILIDARSKERYLGIKDPVDNFLWPRSRCNLEPSRSKSRKNGFFRSSEELKLHFSKLLGEIKPENVISMCFFRNNRMSQLIGNGNRRFQRSQVVCWVMERMDY
ncbi:MAG: hypothetical protein Ct9H90mP18_09860 [Gammaproteobacteria bacterium]|nr:MAG: hypothetical protein Ct9H90mP18_09860 [Gammaproteobacteria bacterium]